MTTLTLDEAAAVLKTTPETVSECIHHRGLPAARLGRAYVLIEADVLDWLRTQYLHVTEAATVAAIAESTPSSRVMLTDALPDPAL